MKKEGNSNSMLSLKICHLNYFHISANLDILFSMRLVTKRRMNWQNLNLFMKICGNSNMSSCCLNHKLINGIWIIFYSSLLWLLECRWCSKDFLELNTIWFRSFILKGYQLYSHMITKTYSNKVIHVFTNLLQKDSIFSS